MNWKSFRGRRWFVLMTVIGIIFIGSWIFFYQENLKSTYTEKYHEPDPTKNKVAVVIGKEGIYDSERVASQVSEYFKAVKKDLDIENAGLKKFEGKTLNDIDKLDKFVDELYLNEDVAYIIFIGDDLPIGDTTNEPTTRQYGAPDRPALPVEPIQYKLGCVNKDCNFRVTPKALKPTKEECVMPPPPISASEIHCKMLRLQKDVGISFILPPVKYSNEDSVNFVLNVLKTYTEYHNNFAELVKEYQQSILAIQHKPDRPIKRVDSNLGFELPNVALFNRGESEKVSDELKKKHIILVLGVHGTRTTVGLGFKNETSQITLEEWSNFTNAYGTPALFVESDASESLIMSPDRRDNRVYCCWPQIFMESGVWAYSSYGMSANLVPGTESLGVRKSLSTGETYGLAIRKNTHTPIIWGDILAHVK